jgi:hypothetical protein
MEIVLVAALAARAARVFPGVAITYPAADQLGRGLRQPIEASLRPTILDGNVLLIDIALLAQILSEGCRTACAGRGAVQVSDYRHSWSLRARSQVRQEDTAGNAANKRSPVHHRLTSETRSVTTRTAPTHEGCRSAHDRW